MPSADASASADVDFLRDQVLRLNAELARQLGQPAPPAGDDAAPWLLDPEQLPPLLTSYDARLGELERGESLQRERADAAEASVRAASAEAAKLRGELAHALETAVRQEALASMGGLERGRPDPAVRELSERLEILYQENEVLTDQQRETSAELERLREEKLSQARDHMSLVKQIGAMRDELAAAHSRTRRSAEARDRARAELQLCASELVTSQEYTQQGMAIAERHATERDAALASVNEHRAMLEQLNTRATSDREALTADLAVARAAERDVRERAELLDGQLRATAEREAQLMDRLGAELKDKSAGAEALSVLEARCADAEGRNEAMTREVQGARQAIHELSMERTSLSTRAETAEAALAKAEDRISAMGQEERSRRDILSSSLKQESSRKNAALEDEVRAMETTIADLNHQLQRLQRERHKPTRLDTATLALGIPSGPLDPSHGTPTAIPHTAAGESSRAVDEMASRLAAAERERDASESQRRTLAMQVRTQGESHTQERSAATARAEQMQRQLRRSEDEVGELRQERAKLLGSIAELEQAVASARSELSALRHGSAEEARIASEASAAEVSSLSRQLADARGLHKQAAAEVEELISAQENLGNRYRGEAKTIAERSEALVSELRAESERLTIRNTELGAQLAAALSRSTQLDQESRESGSKVLQMQREIKELQALRQQQTSVLAQLRAAEKGWQAERKLLMRQGKAEQAVADAASNALARGAQGTPRSREEGGGRGERRKKTAREAAEEEVEEALAAARHSAQPGFERPSASPASAAS